ncbi:hypothetical protein [Rhizobium mongolense]|uniref:Uncharacterized protein n=1 Tax=Rhizobium mongolense TaxID=57676 RepID=A0ABR6IJV7_9HYPH|nr:hypothetical protein [Rhizobium mongolense]MBB4228085.1 hypothetical protein [Rhizobium mongolense]
MFQALEILTVLIVAVAMALALAHALELPGKMRLSKEQYLAGAAHRLSRLYLRRCRRAALPDHDPGADRADATLQRHLLADRRCSRGAALLVAAVAA